jgi:two-component system chemotaxis response regulator CheB
VQHITEGFVHGLVEWLDRHTALRVKVAEDGEPAVAGTVYFAPEHRHLAFGPGDTLVLVEHPPVRSHCPSGELLFASLAERYGVRGMGVMLTGMGDDGADALEELSRAGGVVLAQDEASSVVFGMPGSVVERGLATEVVSLEHLAERMLFWTYGGALGRYKRT